MVKTTSYQLGVAAEDLAAKHFKVLDFFLIAKRYKTKYGEIDLIVSKNNQLIFVEVKARSKKIVLENIITRKQIERNYSAAEFFLSEFPEYSTYDCRFDLLILYQNRIVQHIFNIN